MRSAERRAPNAANWVPDFARFTLIPVNARRAYAGLVVRLQDGTDLRVWPKNFRRKFLLRRWQSPAQAAHADKAAAFVGGVDAKGFGVVACHRGG